MTEVNVAPLNFIDWRDQSESFETMAVARATAFTLRSESGAEKIFGAGVSKDFLEMLGVAPVRGVPLDFEDTASLVPAVRAARIEPSTALRAE